MKIFDLKNKKKNGAELLNIYFLKLAIMETRDLYPWPFYLTNNHIPITPGITTTCPFHCELRSRYCFSNNKNINYRNVLHPNENIVHPRGLLLRFND